MNVGYAVHRVVQPKACIFDMRETLLMLDSVHAGKFIKLQENVAAPRARGCARKTITSE